MSQMTWLKALKTKGRQVEVVTGQLCVMEQ